MLGIGIAIGLVLALGMVLLMIERKRRPPRRRMRVVLCIVIVAAVSSVVFVAMQYRDPVRAGNRDTAETEQKGDWSYVMEKYKGSLLNPDGVSIGTLKYKNVPIPDSARSIRTGMGIFEYSRRDDPLSSGGWWKVKESNAPRMKTNVGAISTQDIDAGFYKTPPLTKKSGTPGNWIYLETFEDGAYFYSPAAFAKFLVGGSEARTGEQ